MARFNEQFDKHGAWRREKGLRLKVLADWLSEHELIDDGGSELMRRLLDQLRSDKVMIAFVAEFSRGKSELINAVFFANYGRRIMPASAGRTTMCPTELGYEADLPPCLRLLPIETRQQPQALMEWRMVPEQWIRINLDVNDPEQLAGAMEKVSEVRRVSQDEARSLGFWHDDRPEDNPPVIDAEGRVEVPRWRHALINMAHPLLRQGLVVLDTPGLNAIGAEPELTINLIPQAQAVVFVLGADTGVTKSDLIVWREHVATMPADAGTRFVVLNKIDTLWDEMVEANEVEAQIVRQRVETARTLGVPVEQVLALSAQKGLLAKVRGDAELLSSSRLPAFEGMLAEHVLGNRQAVLETAIGAGVARLRSGARNIIDVRRRELAEQMSELKGLRGKNQTVIRQMRLRVEQEKGEFDRGTMRVMAVRSVHMRLLSQVFKLLSYGTIKLELAELNAALREPGLKLGVKRSYERGFGNLQRVLTQAQALVGEIQTMLESSFKQLNAEHGLSLQAPTQPDIARFSRDLDVVQRSHLQYLGLGRAVQLSRPDFAEKLLRALLSRIRSIFETALGEVELWNKSSTSQIGAQTRERRSTFARRIEAIERIQQAAGGLDERIDEIDGQDKMLDALLERLDELAHGLSALDTAALVCREEQSALSA